MTHERSVKSVLCDLVSPSCRLSYVNTLGSHEGPVSVVATSPTLGDIASVCTALSRPSRTSTTANSKMWGKCSGTKKNFEIGGKQRRFGIINHGLLFSIVFCGATLYLTMFFQLQITFAPSVLSLTSFSKP